MTESLPYVQEIAGSPITIQPYQFNDAELAWFFLKCDENAINGLLDRFINLPSQGAASYH